MSSNDSNARANAQPADPSDGEPSGVVRARPRIQARDMHYGLIDPRAPESAVGRAAYELWRSVWGTTFRELDGVTRIHSDEFTRQDQIGVLLVNGECATVTALRWLDLSHPAAHDDSYFRLWPPELLASLGRIRVCISSNSAIAPAWRGSLVVPESADVLPLTLKEAVIGTTLLRFRESTAQACIGVARNDRSMNRVATSLRARCIGQLVMHGIESDVVFWSRADVADLGPLLEDLWSRRIPA